MNDPSSLAAQEQGMLARAGALWPGVLVCMLLALSASFVSEHYGGPPLLYALLMGLSLNFLSSSPTAVAGIGFCARTLLRVGVALLGVRVTFGQVADLGSVTAVMVIGALVATILFGCGLARLLGSPRDHGLLSGAAVGICGASAALAISSVLPPTRENERFTLLTVVGVTLLSTVAMVVYPLLLKLSSVSPLSSGVFLGATIHDVAQVVAAGTLLGPQVAETAVVIKLLRVMMLAPVAMCIAVAVRGRSVPVTGASVPLLPGFMIGFILLVGVTSFGLVPPAAVELASSTSRWCLITAIGAAGLKAHFEELTRLGWRPLVLLGAETLFLAMLAGAAIYAGAGEGLHVKS